MISNKIMVKHFKSCFFSSIFLFILLILLLSTFVFAAPTPKPACSDRIDNDQDGKIDYPNDPGCVSKSDTSELNTVIVYQCSDGIDNDQDGKIDYPNDPGCSSSSDNDETNIIPSCSLTSASWSTTTSVQGQPVNLIVTGNNCDGKTISFAVWEDDIVGDESANINPINVNFVGNTATSSWISEWQCDGDIGGICTLGNPEYYFIAILATNSSIKITSSNLLSTTALSSSCGNNITQGTEQCDDGNTNNSDRCSTTCTLTYCGDSIIQSPNGYSVNEICDSNSQVCNINSYSGSRTCLNSCLAFGACTTTQYCGDGIVNGPEQCDDNNTNSGDGCSATCTTEVIIVPVCGNGVIESGEQCDDNNSNNDDSCNNLCKNVNIILVKTSGFQPLFDGETNSYLSSVEYCNSVVSGTGIRSSYGFRACPDNWHSPRITAAGDGFRVNWENYDYLEFYLKSESTVNNEINFSLSKWPGLSSNVIKVKDYIEEGIIDNKFRIVRVPISALKTNTWQLDGVEAFVFSTDNQNRNFVVDNIVLRDSTPPSIINVVSETQNIIRIEFSEWFSIPSIRNPSNYKLTSLSDSDYQTSRSPIDTGAWVRFQTYNGTSSSAVKNNYQVFIKMDKNFKSNSVYSLSISNITDISDNLINPVTMSFTYNDYNLNTHLKVSQVGYLPESPKYGFVADYFGDLGGGTWAVGNQGTIYYYDKLMGWVQQSSPSTQQLNAVSGTREDDIWAVGNAGTIIRFNGTGWNSVTSPVTSNLNSIYFDEKNIGWVVGDNGVILKYNNSWQIYPSPTTRNLREVSYQTIVGDSGTVLTLNNNAWSLVPVYDRNNNLITDNLNGVGYRQGIGRMYLVGDNGLVLLEQWGSYHEAPISRSTTNSLKKISMNPANPSDKNAYIVGNNGLLWEITRGGNSYIDYSIGGSESLNSVAYETLSQWWAVGMNGKIVNIQKNSRNTTSLIAPSFNGVFSLPFGEMRLPKNNPSVEIVRTSDQAVVATLNPELRFANYYLSGEDVYLFNFSSLKTPGTYYARMNGIGKTAPFVIGNEAFDNVTYHSGRMLYYSRSGTPLSPPYADSRFSRGLDHEFNPSGRMIDGAFHESLLNSPLYAGEIVCPLSQTSCPSNSMINVSGGWFDAGDYGKYISTAPPSLWNLFAGYEMLPSAFGDSNNIPESGNGIPDILDEARWELNWMQKMQASDGGVYNKVVAQTWESGMPDSADLGGYPVRYIMEKTTGETATTGAIFAMASRIWRDIDPVFSAELMRQAEKAWRFLELHPITLPVGGYENPPGHNSGNVRDANDSDERSWFAAEMYRATGNQTYHQYLINLGYTGEACKGSYESGTSFTKQCQWAYLHTNFTTNQTVINVFRNNFIFWIGEREQELNNHPYPLSARIDVAEWIGWSTLGGNTINAFYFLLAYNLTNNQNYLESAYKETYSMLGENPLAMSFITGVGNKYPISPLFNQAIYDNNIEPIPGYNVFGVFNHIPFGNEWYTGAQIDANNYPSLEQPESPFPNLRRYADHYTLVNYNEGQNIYTANNMVLFPILKAKGINNEVLMSPEVEDNFIKRLLNRISGFAIKFIDN